MASAVSHVAFFDQIRNIAGVETYIFGITTRSSEGLHRLAGILRPFRAFGDSLIRWAMPIAGILCPFRAVKFFVTVHHIICA